MKPVEPDDPDVAPPRIRRGRFVISSVVALASSGAIAGLYMLSKPAPEQKGEMAANLAPLGHLISYGLFAVLVIVALVAGTTAITTLLENRAAARNLVGRTGGAQNSPLPPARVRRR